MCFKINKRIEQTTMEEKVEEIYKFQGYVKSMKVTNKTCNEKYEITFKPIGQYRFEDDGKIKIIGYDSKTKTFKIFDNVFTMNCIFYFFIKSNIDALFTIEFNHDKEIESIYYEN